VLSEPYLGPGTNQVVFSLQLGANGTLTPSSQWYILWNRTAAAADGSDRRFVAMKTDAAGALSFVYGDFGPPLDPLNPAPNANTPTVLGNADFGSFDAATGLATLRLSDNLLDQGGRAPGQDLTGVNVRTYLARPDAGQRSQNNASDISADGSYSLVGNAACFCMVDHAPSAGLTAAPTSGMAPLTVRFDGSSSFDPDGADGDGVGSYTFTFADGTAPVTQASPVIQHTYTQSSGPSGYFATLTVADQKCGTRSVNVASVSIAVGGSTTGLGDPTVMPASSFSLIALGTPSRGATSFLLGLERSGPVRVSVFDTDGRRVADLANAWMPAGTHPLRWEGRDTRGLRAPAGVYLVRARAGEGEKVSRITLLN